MATSPAPSTMPGAGWVLSTHLWKEWIFLFQLHTHSRGQFSLQLAPSPWQPLLWQEADDVAFLFQSLRALKKKNHIPASSVGAASVLSLVSQQVGLLFWGMAFPLGSELPRLCEQLIVHLPPTESSCSLLTAILGCQKYFRHTWSVRRNLHLRKRGIVPFQYSHSKMLKILFFCRKRINNCHFGHVRYWSFAISPH